MDKQKASDELAKTIESTKREYEQKKATAAAAAAAVAATASAATGSKPAPANITNGKTTSGTVKGPVITRRNGAATGAGGSVTIGSGGSSAAADLKLTRATKTNALTGEKEEIPIQTNAAAAAAPAPAKPKIVELASTTDDAAPSVSVAADATKNAASAAPISELDALD